MTSQLPVCLEMDVSYPDFKVSLTPLSMSQLKFEIEEEPLRHSEIARRRRRSPDAIGAMRSSQNSEIFR